MFHLGIACAIGACAGLLVSHTCETHPLLTPLIGGFTAMFAHSPGEVSHILWSVLMFHWVKPAQERLCAMRPAFMTFLGELWIAIGITTYVFFSFALIGALIAGLHVFDILYGLNVSNTEIAFPMSISVPLILWIFGGVWEGSFRYAQSTPHAYFPILRRFPVAVSVFSVFWIDERNNKKFFELKVHERLGFLFGLIFCLPIVGIVGAFILLVDSVLSVCILCARTHLLAAFSGGAVGATAGELIQSGGFMPASQPIAALCVGAIVGFCAGPLFYQTMAILAQPTKVTTITTVSD